MLHRDLSPCEAMGQRLSDSLPMLLPPLTYSTTMLSPNGAKEDVVFLHWRLLREIGDLCNPATPLEEKLDTLRWIFTDRDKESRPFSFVNCLKVVGCSSLSPLPYIGLVDAEEIRDAIRCHAKSWLNATLARYPDWVRDAVLTNPGWVESRLAKNPQWINEQIKKTAAHGDLFV